MNVNSEDLPFDKAAPDADDTSDLPPDVKNDPIDEDAELANQEDEESDDEDGEDEDDD